MKPALQFLKALLQDLLYPPPPFKGSIQVTGVGVASDMGPQFKEISQEELDQLGVVAHGDPSWSWRDRAIEELVKIMDREDRRMRKYDPNCTPHAHELMLNKYRMDLESISDPKLFDLLIEETAAEAYNNGHAAERGI